MKAKVWSPKIDPHNCFVQPKLNGVRCLYQNGTFQSGDERIWKPGVLAHIAKVIRFHKLDSVILDGELYVHGWRLARINGAVATNRSAPNTDTLQVQYHIFDIVDTDKPFHERNEFLNRMFARWFGGGLVQRVETHRVSIPAAVDNWFKHFTASGYEGLMLRRADAFYEFGMQPGKLVPHPTLHRSRGIYKYKSWSDSEFSCVGITTGIGKASCGIGALICMTESGKDFKVGTGLTDEDRILFATKPPLHKFIKIRYLELTADGIPFNPSFLCVMD